MRRLGVEFAGMANYVEGESLYSQALLFFNPRIQREKNEILFGGFRILPSEDEIKGAI